MTRPIELPADLSARLAEDAKVGIRWEGLGQADILGKLKPSAVLLPLIRLDNQWQLIYTLRSVHLQDHCGQVSFPGGSWEPSDSSLVQTALRESWEEIGLDPAAVQVMGCMAPMAMVTRFVITPVVGIVDWPTELTVNPDEVDRVFSIPLDWLADAANREFRVHTHEGIDLDVAYFKRYDGEIVWGATAMMTLNFLSLLDL
ncbi:MAG: CoA pyrophosphatase [Anaerolineaceae bacterium]|nr:CoA pyrophosphatase [Anaerolineaceae bacterium]